MVTCRQSATNAPPPQLVLEGPSCLPSPAHSALSCLQQLVPQQDAV